MPRLPLTISLYADRVVFLTISYISQLLYYCFLGAIVLGVARLLILAGLALWKRIARRAGRRCRARRPPAVTVLIPAFNEEKVIVTTIERILASDYPDMEVLVIDDGSKDHTAYIVRSHFMRDSRVGVISIPNGGKANALNVGHGQCQGRSDRGAGCRHPVRTHDTISRLVRWFADPTIGAVAGNAKVGNRINMITRWQALEYIVAQNLERRALVGAGHADGGAGRGRAPGGAMCCASWAAFPPTRWRKTRTSPSPSRSRAIGCMFDSTAIAWTEAPATVQRPGQAALPLGLWHAAMPVEVSPHHLQSPNMASWAWWRCRRSGCSRSC